MMRPGRPLPRARPRRFRGEKPVSATRRHCLNLNSRSSWDDGGKPLNNLIPAVPAHQETTVKKENPRGERGGICHPDLQWRPATRFLRRYFFMKARSHSTQVALSTSRSATCPCLHGLPVKYRFSPFAFASALEMICMPCLCLLTEEFVETDIAPERQPGRGRSRLPGAYTRH